MELHGKKIKYVCSEQEDDITFLQSLVKEECADFEVHYSSKQDAKKMPQFFMRLRENSGKQHTYLSEVRGRKDNRAPSWLKQFFDWPTPDPWVANVTDEHYLGYSDTKNRQKLGVVTDERFLFQYSKLKISRAGHAKDLEIK